MDNADGIAFYRTRGYTQRARVARMYHGLVDGVRLEKRLRDDEA